MENRYYKPELEEFHVGFEFEFKDWWTDGGVVDKEGKKGSEYQKYTLTPWDFYSTEHKEKQRGGSFGVDYEHIFDRIQKYINNEDVRVKYLDQEDIESLGWEHEHPYAGAISFVINDKGLDFYPDNRVVIHNMEPWDGFVSYFDGTIKNKSELKKIMKMIGI